MAKPGDELVNPVTGLRTVFRKTARDTDGHVTWRGTMPRARPEPIGARGAASQEYPKQKEYPKWK